MSLTRPAHHQKFAPYPREPWHAPSSLGAGSAFILRSPRPAASPRAKLVPLQRDVVGNGIAGAIDEERQTSDPSASSTAVSRHQPKWNIMPMAPSPKPPMMSRIANSWEQAEKILQSPRAKRTLRSKAAPSWRPLTWTEQRFFKSSKDNPTMHSEASSERCVRDLTFHPGELGLFYSFQSGLISRVCPGSQADIAGVRPGWSIAKLDDQPFAPSWLYLRARGSCDYSVTFSVPAEEVNLPRLCIAPPESIFDETEGYSTLNCTSEIELPPLAPKEEPWEAHGEDAPVAPDDEEEPPEAPDEEEEPPEAPDEDLYISFDDEGDHAPEKFSDGFVESLLQKRGPLLASEVVFKSDGALQEEEFSKISSRLATPPLAPREEPGEAVRKAAEPATQKGLSKVLPARMLPLDSSELLFDDINDMDFDRSGLLATPPLAPEEEPPEAPEEIVASEDEEPPLAPTEEVAESHAVASTEEEPPVAPIEEVAESHADV